MLEQYCKIYYNKNMMNRSFITAFIIILCSALLTGCVSKPVPKSKLKPSEQIEKNEESALAKEDIIKMQEQIVTLRQRILDDTQIKLDNAQATLLDLADARQKLADAKIKLDELQNRSDLVVEDLQSLFQFYVTTRGKMVDELDAGKGKAKELYELEIALIETNIRLSEAMQKFK